MKVHLIFLLSWQYTGSSVWAKIEDNVYIPFLNFISQVYLSMETKYVEF